MDKFGRIYKLLVETKDGAILVFELPYTIEFTINRNTLSKANNASIRIYNLTKETRNRILKDQWDVADKRTVTLMIGYGSNLSTVMKGNISFCRSQKEGTNIVTNIECFSMQAALANSFLKEDCSFTKGTSNLTVVNTLVDKLKEYGITKGRFGTISGELKRGLVLTGSTIKALQEFTNGNFFVDNDKAYVLDEDETLSGSITVVNAASGLLKTPIKDNARFDFTMILEPQLLVGQWIYIQSITSDRKQANDKEKDPFSTEAKIVSLNHTGMISGTVAGSATTTVGTFIGKQAKKV